MHDAHPVTTTAEGGGLVLTCTACEWTRYVPGEKLAQAARAEHVAKCKGPKVVTEAAPKAARSIGWNDREGATWIDSL